MPLTDKTFSQCQPCWGFKPANQIFPKLHMDVLRRSGMKEDGVKDKWERPRRKEEEEGGQSQLLRSDRIQFCFHCVKSSELSSVASRALWEEAISLGISCQKAVILLWHRAMLPSPYWLAENAVQRGLLFQIPTSVVPSYCRRVQTVVTKKRSWKLLGLDQGILRKQFSIIQQRVVFWACLRSAQESAVSPALPAPLLYWGCKSTYVMSSRALAPITG